MECAEALRLARSIAEAKPLGTQTCRIVAEVLEQHYRRMCPCFTRLAEWPFAVKPARIDWDLFDE